LISAVFFKSVSLNKRFFLYLIPEKEFSAMGYGEFRPVVAMDTISQNLLAIKDANSKNRRVEIYLDAFLKTNVITQ